MLQAALSPKPVHVCIHYLRVCSFPLFLLLAQGTCSSRPWDLPGLRLSNAFKVSWHLPAPSSHGAPCGVCREQLSPHCSQGQGLECHSL